MIGVIVKDVYTRRIVYVGDTNKYSKTSDFGRL